MVELGYPYPVPGGDDPAIAPADMSGSLLGANLAGQTKRLTVDDTSTNSLFVHITADDPASNGSALVNTYGTPNNIYGAVLAPFNTETNIISYTVPVGKKFSITSVELWGDYFGEYFVKINGTQKGGTNVSAAERSKTLIYPYGPIVATAGQIVTISIQHQAMGSVNFHANLMGGLQ